VVAIFVEKFWKQEGGSVGERFEKVRGGVLYMIRKTRRRGECAGLRSQNVFPW